MNKQVTKFIISIMALFVGAYLLPGISIDSLLTSIIVAIVLSFLNMFLRPVFILLTLPFTIITFGLFLIVINACLFLLTDWLVPGFEIGGMWDAIFYSIIYSLTLSFLSYLLGLDKEKRK
ncbi:phage holin family protein [Rapidithrix thailandica]|uniref:Phage holin family protein n=1 Tax=Rapidithrix thailandica TaxID=413964 RepID=A0AAW9S6F2_9BACT